LLQDPAPVASSAYHTHFTSRTSCLSWQVRGFTQERERDEPAHTPSEPPV